MKEITLLIVYSSDLKRRFEKNKDDPGRIIAELGRTVNKVYTERRALPVRFNMVHSAHVGYDESMNDLTDLNWVAGNDKVSELRNEYKADLVGLLLDDTNSCGRSRGYSNGDASFGYFVTDYDCEFKYTMAHEIGHNLSARHNREAHSAYKDSTSCNHGYINTKDLRRSLMAYDCDDDSSFEKCPRQMHFSDASISMGVECVDANPAQTWSENWRIVQRRIPSVSEYVK